MKEADAAFADALVIQKQLADDFPTRPDYREGLATLYYNQGNVLRDTARPKEAEAAFTNALVIRKQLAADFPTRPEFRQDLATSHNNLGNLFRATGHAKEAEAALAAALAIHKELAADFPKLPTYHHSLAGTLVNLALLALERRDLCPGSSFAGGGRAAPPGSSQANSREPDYREFYRNNLAA